MHSLIRVGFFREFRRDAAGRASLPSIKDSLSEIPQEDESKIVDYLRNGKCVGARGGYVDDVLNPESRVPLLAHLYTDGVYLWRHDLAHYVEHYHLTLPNDFISHMSSQGWMPPPEDEIQLPEAVQ